MGPSKKSRARDRRIVLKDKTRVYIMWNKKSLCWEIRAYRGLAMVTTKDKIRKRAFKKIKKEFFRFREPSIAGAPQRLRALSEIKGRKKKSEIDGQG